MGKNATNIGLSLLLGDFESFDKEMVQSLSGIGQRLEVDYQTNHSHEDETFQRKSKEEYEEDYKTLFLGGLIDKISKKSYEKIKNYNLQAQEGMEHGYFESQVEIKTNSSKFSKIKHENDYEKEIDEFNCVPDERLNVNNLDIVKWEDDIIWEGATTDSLPMSLPNSYSIPEDLFDDMSGDWGRIKLSEEEELPVVPSPKDIIPHLSNEPIIEETSSLPETFVKKKRKYRKKKKDIFTSNEITRVAPKEVVDKPIIEKENLQFLNDDLLNCEWIDDIYWDDSQPIQKEQKLILDLNDKDMIYDIDLETKDFNNDISIESLFQTFCNEISHADEIIPKKFHVQHSKPALELDSKHYKLFPKGKAIVNKNSNHFKKNEMINLNYSKPKRAKKSIQSRQDLTALDNQLVLMEFIERSPSLINKFGMATNIVNYYKKPKTFQPIPISKDGITQIVEDEDEIPLLTNLEIDGKIITTQNNMYSSQIYEQKVKNSDFLLCSRISSNGKRKWFIREIPSEYLVGHIQPKIEIYPPRTRSLDSYINNALSYYICKLFKDKIRNRKKAKISVSDISSKFDDLPRQTIREKLKEFATFDRKGDVWIAKQELLPSDEDLARLVTPEMICVNESMILGDYKLNSQNIDDRSDMVAYELSFAKLEDKYRQLIKSIERVKNNLPWEHSNNFQLCFKSNKENVKLELLELVQENVKNIEKFVEEIDKQIEIETEDIHPSMSDSHARSILINSKQFTEESITNMSRSERKSNARQLLKNQEKSMIEKEDLDKRSAKTQARISIFKDALRDVYLKESLILSNGLNYFETSDKEVKELILKKKGRTNFTFHNTISYLENADSNDSLSSISKSEISDQLQTLSTTLDESKKKRGRKKKISLNNLSNQYVKKTIMVNNQPKIEYIHDPIRVSYYQQVQKSKRRSKHFIGAQDKEQFSVGPRERSRLQALSKEFKKKFNSTNRKEEAIQKLLCESAEKNRNTTIKNASSSSPSSKKKRKDDRNQSSNNDTTSLRQPKKKTKIN